MTARRSSRKRSHESSSTKSSSSTTTTISTVFSNSDGSSNHNNNTRAHLPKKQLLLSKTNHHRRNTIFSWFSLAQRVNRILSLSSATLRAVLVLGLAIVMGMAWNYWEGVPYASDDPGIRSFLTRVCKNKDNNNNNNNNNIRDDAYCHPSLVPRRRTQMAIRPIRKGERILEIPRSLQIWDLDALRHDWIRQNLQGAKHRPTGNFVDSAAYLAMYLALLSSQATTTTTTATTDDNSMDTRLVSYLKDCLPTGENLQTFHPIFWNDTELLQLIPTHTAAFGVAKAYRDMVRSEYQAFADAALQQGGNSHLDTIVSEQDYVRFRTLVLSRSFGTGQLLPDSSRASSADAADSIVSQDELEHYQNEFGIDLSRGSYAMVPLLDFYDHHARPNVEYTYQSDSQVFVIQATQAIAAGQEMVDSYGKYTDAHLFGKFGFVNGDGSGYSQALLATHHLLLDLDLKQQFSYLPHRRNPERSSEALRNALDKQAMAVRQYLRFDDGYEHCVPPLKDTGKSKDEDTKAAQDLKRLKLQHLAKIANHSQRWHLVLLPRAPESLPARASNIPITYVPPQISKRNSKFFHRKEYQLLAATCRLISLTHEDYDGNAIHILQKNLSNNSFLLESQLTENSERDSPAAALEFRTHFCLARLATEALQRFGVSLADMEDKVATLNRKSFQSKEWTAAHLLLSEMQALEVLRGVSFSAAREHEEFRNMSPLFTIRDTPCPDFK